MYFKESHFSLSPSSLNISFTGDKVDRVFAAAIRNSAQQPVCWMEELRYSARFLLIPM